MSEKLYGDAVELYDLAFSWDIMDEVSWLLDRLGTDEGPLLEPGCGTGRFLEALGRRGVSATGIDRSPEMVAFARRRLAPWAALVDVVERDMVEFNLGRRFVGAFCPVNTLGYLAPGALVRHLEVVAGHLEAGGRYLMQLDLRDPDGDPRGTGSWTASRDGEEAHVSWSVEGSVPARRIERHRARIEVTAGPRAGEVLDEVHVLTSWTPEQFRLAVEVTPFSYTAVYDGDRPDRREVSTGTAGELLWHDLRRTEH